MAESGFAGAFGNVQTSAASSVTYYGNYGNSAGAQTTAETTEVNASLVHRGSNVTLKNLRVIVMTNTRAATSSVTTRQNAADTAQVATITASTTGTYTDLVDTVSLVATDTVGYKLVVGSTSGNLLVSGISANFESSGQAFGFWSNIGTVSTAVASVTRFYTPVGWLTAAQSVEINTQCYAPAAGTISNLRAYVTAARATATTLKSRIGAADGAQSVSITGTGAFEDTSNSDTLSVGSLFNIATLTSTGTDTLTIVGLSYKYTPSTAGVTALGIGPGSNAALGAGTTRYAGPTGHLTLQASENTQQVGMTYAGTLEALSAVVSANASTTTSTVVLRVGGVDSAVTFTIAGGATGSFTDSTHSASVAVADLVSVKASGSDGSVTFRSMSMKLTASSNSVTGTASITEAGDTVSSASTLALKATSAITEAGDTVSSASTLALKAAAAITEAGDTVSSAASLPIKAAAAITEAGDTISATGTLPGAGIVGSAAITEADDTLSSAAHVDQPGVTAVAAITEEDDTIYSLARSRFWSAVSVTTETWSPVSPTAEIWTAA